jgi:hypothetical protein
MEVKVATARDWLMRARKPTLILPPFAFGKPFGVAYVWCSHASGCSCKGSNRTTRFSADHELLEIIAETMIWFQSLGISRRQVATMVSGFALFSSLSTARAAVLAESRINEASCWPAHFLSMATPFSDLQEWNFSWAPCAYILEW